jgi:hypothetical protein
MVDLAGPGMFRSLGMAGSRPKKQWPAYIDVAAAGIFTGSEK